MSRAKSEITTEDIVAVLKSRQGDRKVEELAGELKVSPSYIWEIYSGRRKPGAKIVARLGLKVRLVYEPLTAQEIAAMEAWNEESR